MSNSTEEIAKVKLSESDEVKKNLGCGRTKSRSRQRPAPKCL